MQDRLPVPYGLLRQIALINEEPPYLYKDYVTGYRRTGFPEDNDNYIEEWSTMLNAAE